MNNLAVVMEQARRFEASCAAAELDIMRAQSMRDVQRAAEVRARPELVSAQHTGAAWRHLKAAAETRLAALLSNQLSVMATSSLDVAETLFARYRREDWQPLRGAYGHLFLRGETEGRKLLATKRSVMSAGTSTRES